MSHGCDFSVSFSFHSKTVDGLCNYGFPIGMGHWDVPNNRGSIIDGQKIKYRFLSEHAKPTPGDGIEAPVAGGGGGDTFC